MYPFSKFPKVKFHCASQFHLLRSKHRQFNSASNTMYFHRVATETTNPV